MMLNALRGYFEKTIFVIKWYVFHMFSKKKVREGHKSSYSRDLTFPVSFHAFPC